jgi:putative ABC transport system permease protein
MGLFLTAVRLAFGSLVANKVRSTLTTVGVLVGVAAVMAIISATRASADAVADEIADSNGMLFVFPDLIGAAARHRADPFLTEGDTRAIARECGHVTGVVPVVDQRITIVNGAHNARTRLVGFTGPYFEMRRMKIAAGEAWRPDDETPGEIAVIGKPLAERLFGHDDPVGRTIRVGRASLRVVGVLARHGGDDSDNRLFVPIRVVRARIIPARDKRIDYILLQPRSQADAKTARSEVTSLLKHRHHGKQEFRMGSELDGLRERQETVSTLSMLFVTVAAVSLIVGGVGVMNIMLVSVAERTREIGIRISIGAQAHDILLQYLIEAVLLTLLGGVLGVIVGVAGSGALAEALDLEVHLSIGSAVAGLAVSVGMGVIFGFFPALHAARLDPIEALRTE